MRNIGKCFLLILMATLFLPLGYAQTEPRMDYAPKPPGSPSRVLLDNWNSIGRKLIAMAEDFPEDKYDFKPTPAQRSFAEQLLHAAGANYFFINPVKGVMVSFDLVGCGNPHHSRGRTRFDRLLDVGYLSVAWIFHGLGTDQLGRHHCAAACAA